MQMHIIVTHATSGPTYTLVVQQEGGGTIRLLCRNRDDAYALGATLAGAIEVHTRLEVEYL